MHLQGGISYDFYFLIYLIIIIWVQMKIAMMIFTICALNITIISSIEVQLVKRNVYIPKNAHFLSNV